MFCLMVFAIDSQGGGWGAREKSILKLWFLFNCRGLKLQSWHVSCFNDIKLRQRIVFQKFEIYKSEMSWKCSKITMTLKLSNQFQSFFQYSSSDCVCFNISCLLPCFYKQKHFCYLFKFCPKMPKRYPLFEVGYQGSCYSNVH